MTVIDETTRTNPPTRRLPAAYGAPALRSLWCCTGFVLCPSACSRGRSRLEGSEAKHDTSRNMKGVVTAPPVEPQANKAGRVVGAYTTCPAQLLQVILTPKMVTCSCKSRAKLGHIKMQNSAETWSLSGVKNGPQCSRHHAPRLKPNEVKGALRQTLFARVLPVFNVDLSEVMNEG